MTDKRCVRTGQKASLRSEIYVRQGDVWCLQEINGILIYACHPADYDDVKENMLRDATKLERLLEMTDNE